MFVMIVQPYLQVQQPVFIFS